MVLVDEAVNPPIFASQSHFYLLFLSLWSLCGSLGVPILWSIPTFK
jgi:hypothetical protein